VLDDQLKNQLKSLFHELQAPVQLMVRPSSHAKQSELVEMLEEIAELTPHIDVIHGGTADEIPSFDVLRDKRPTGVSFRGIPGGHEFSSLILALLNAAGLGKLPDEGTRERIRHLEPGLQIATYVSLSCENCPDVVQALNQITLVHGSITHTTIDGALVDDELQKRGIQGVPTVLINDELFHVGRASMGDLLVKLEQKYGTPETSITPRHLGHFDVAVVGGGPAGAAAAIYSVRKGLKTALITDRIGGQVQETRGIENMIGLNYVEGPQLSGNLSDHLRQYPVTFLEHRKVEHIEDGKVKTVGLDSRETLSTDAVIIATGARWRELGIPGEKEYLGRGVAFCPHCEGPFYKNKKVAVIGGGNSGVEAAIDLAGICREVVLFEFMDKLKADDVLIRKLETLSNVSTVLNAQTTAIVGNGEKVNGMSYRDRLTDENLTVEVDGVFVQIGLSANSSVFQGLLETNRFGEIVVDDRCRTSRTGFYAAGDVTTVPFKQIVIAMGEGAKAALSSFEDRMRSQT
jgi:alkyl hydroperoxide reductase subunit F